MLRRCLRKFKTNGVRSKRRLKFASVALVPSRNKFFRFLFRLRACFTRIFSPLYAIRRTSNRQLIIRSTSWAVPLHLLSSFSAINLISTTTTASIISMYPPLLRLCGSLLRHQTPASPTAAADRALSPIITTVMTPCRLGGCAGSCSAPRSPPTPTIIKPLQRTSAMQWRQRRPLPPIPTTTKICMVLRKVPTPHFLRLCHQHSAARIVSLEGSRMLRSFTAARTHSSSPAHLLVTSLWLLVFPLQEAALLAAPMVVAPLSALTSLCRFLLSHLPRRTSALSVVGNYPLEVPQAQVGAGSTGSGTGRLPLPQLPRLPIAPMPQQDAFQNCRRMSENDNINENVVHEETEDEEDTPSEQTRRRGETDEGFLNNHTNVVALPQLVIHPAFVVAEANLFKPRNPLEPDSPISVHNSNANNFGGNPPHQGEEEQLRAPPPAVPTTYQQPPQQHESELRPHAPSNQQSSVTTRPFFRTILVQEEARAAELAAAAHPSASSPPPLSRASAMPSSSSRQLMFNQSFVPLKLMTSGSTLDQQQAQSLVSDEIGAASFASW
ncbi:Hypothetical protein, putative [Bodo saltans]|uniref:Uncharacterized protein n=1 Tax=Bodo saltans TaxID=75058 RepID=A0A0S4IMT2_BODSA|nr:Hypothetical protein, putative [Bodo saltans]|eukprot:CUF53377.1 Hypothetical protein, putative [Bodo saltans]